MSRSFAIPILVLALAGSGCASIPEDYPPLANARSDYRAAATNPQVVELAPLELKKAERTLQRAEALQNENADADRIDHQAYLASQRARIAQEMAARRAAEYAIEQADAMRKDILLQARNREVQTAASEVRAARAQAAAAEMRSEALEARVQQLQGALEQAQMPETDRGYVLTLGAEVLFDFDQADLKPGAKLLIAKIADFLREEPSRYIAIEGFTDNVGSDAYNRSLSERRARAVEDALVAAHGIDPSRIETRGYGEAYPVATNATPAGRQLNRRVEIVLASDGRPIVGRP
jgi:outer membrane protein OmpA-like peptidoglycan-associated protein